MKKFIYRYIAKISFTVFAIVALTSIWVFHHQSGTPNQTLSTLLTLDIVLYAIIFFAGYFKNYRIQVFFFIVAVTTGIYSFLALTIQEYSLPNAVYSTFRLFLLDLDPVFVKPASLFTQYPLAVEIARWSAAAYTISTVFSLIYTLFYQKVRLFGYRVFKNHMVVSGYHRKSLTLIENLRKEHKKVVLLAEEITEAQRHYLEELGVIVFVGRQGDHSNYKKSKLKQAEYFIIFHEDDSKNLNEILALHEFVDKDWSNLHTKQVIFHLESNQTFELFEDLEKDLDIQSIGAKGISLKPFNVHRLLANELFDQIPLYEGYEERVRDSEGEPLHLLFIGFGQTAQQLAAQAIERSAFLSQALLKITVLDKEAVKVKKQWEDQYPQSKKVVEIQFHSLNIELESAYLFLKKQQTEFTHLFVCLREDSLDLKEGIQLAKNMPDIPIYLKVMEEAQISQWLHSHKGKYDKLHLFGNHQAILTYDYVVNDVLEGTAKTVHENYKNSKKSSSDILEWKELSTFLKESNRNQLSHAYTKLMLLNMKAVKQEEVETQGFVPLTEQQFLDEAEQLLESLAAAEHHRWNMFHYLRGWDTLEDLSNGTKNVEKKLHGCLVSYEELKRIQELTGEDYKQYDREVVLDLYGTMESLGYKIVKCS